MDFVIRKLLIKIVEYNVSTWINMYLLNLYMFIFILLLLYKYNENVNWKKIFTLNDFNNINIYTGY